MAVSGEDEKFALSRALVVTLRFQGVALPSRGTADIELQAPELALIEALAQGPSAPLPTLIDDVARTAGVPSDRLRTLVEALRARDLLRPRTADQPHAGRTDRSTARASNAGHTTSRPMPSWPWRRPCCCG